ncbi:hypothetical protein Cgig2_032310 [Carnegiea gigantea]|uniref:Uncharacterized protein n=1 Tax=Carnegiea gigantea TaxID=171969 RepID=A0A9Q1GHL7_9CARY|nr:hypothetical protein Cgig2_032310 [Carnegiea gigantea]
MVVKEGMGVEELMKMVREMTASDMLEEKLWYSLKYDREMLVAVEGDSDMKVIFKGNDEHGCMYVAGNGGPVRRAQERGAFCKGRVRDCGEGRQIARSGRKCDDGVEVGEEGCNNQAGEKWEQVTIEMSYDNEISVGSKDAGDKEPTKEDDAGDEQAAEKRCVNGNKRQGCADGNDVNDSVWPCSGMQA